MGIFQQGVDLVKLPLAPDEAGQTGGQVVGPRRFSHTCLKRIVFDLLVEVGSLAGWLDPQLIFEQVAALLVLFAGFKTQPFACQEAHHLDVGFLKPGIQLKQTAGMGKRLVIVCPPFVNGSQLLEGILRLLRILLTLYLQPIFEQVTVSQRKLCQEIPPVEIGGLFQALTAGLTAFEATMVVGLTGLQQVKEARLVQVVVAGAVELDRIVGDE